MADANNLEQTKPRAEADVDTSPNEASVASEGWKSLPVGTLCGMEWSKRPNIDLKLSQKSAFKDLARTCSQRDMPARREEIIRVWEARLFWRGYQHLIPRANGGWKFPTVGTGYNPREGSAQSMFELNIYASAGEVIISALTREIPKVRFAPCEPDNDKDLTAARQADKMKDKLCRNLKVKGLLAESTRFLWTDGRCLLNTSYMKDAQRFGWKPEPAGIVPEEESEQIQNASSEALAAPQNAEGTPAEGETPEVKPPREPRGGVVVTPVGALESKIPIKANDLYSCDYLLWEEEVSQPKAQALFPKMSDKITPATGGPGGDDIARLARINVLLGVEDNFVTSDSQAYDTTIQRWWFRPNSFLEIKDKATREEIIELFPDGAFIIFAGQECVQARNESMDDHWSLIHALPGDGAHRNGLGTKMIQAQKLYNQDMELANDYLVRGVPMKWMDGEMFDVEHISTQTNTPGGVRPFVADPIRPASDFIFVEPVIPFPQELLAMTEALQGDITFFLSGVVPALSGGDTGSNDTGYGIKLQRDQALGRIGIPWRNIKESVACVMKQAVMTLAQNHDEDIKEASERLGNDPIIVELEDLKGNILCYPETDENFPLSFTEKSNRLVELETAASSAPDGELAKIAYNPLNSEVMKNMTGITDLYIPTLASYEKMLGEADVLLKGQPLPNPKLNELQEAAAKLTQQVQADPTTAPQIQQQLAQIAQQLQTLPKEVSSVEVDEEVDNHQIEAETCQALLIEPRCRMMKNGTTEEQTGYANLRLHFLEHKAAAARQAAANKPAPPEKGVTKSVSAGDLIKAGVPPEQAVQIITSI